MNFKTHVGGAVSPAQKSYDECIDMMRYITTLSPHQKQEYADSMDIDINTVPNNLDECIAQKKKEFIESNLGKTDHEIDAEWVKEPPKLFLDPQTDLPQNPEKYVLSKCGQPGWGMVQESCWTDTFLYVIFGSDILSDIFVNDLEQLKQTDTDIALIVRALSYYLMGMSGKSSQNERIKSKYYLVRLMFEYVNKKQNNGQLVYEKNASGVDDLRATYLTNGITLNDCFPGEEPITDIHGTKLEDCIWDGNIQFLINFFVMISNNRYILEYMSLIELEKFNSYLNIYNLPLPKIFFITTSAKKNTKRIDTFMTFHKKISKKIYHYDLVGVIKGGGNHYTCYTTCNIPNYYNVAAQYLNKPSYYFDWYFYNNTSAVEYRPQYVPFLSFKPRYTGSDESDTTREDTILEVPDGGTSEFIFIYVLRPTSPIKHKKFKSRTKPKPKHTSLKNSVS
jgi:hypothetical protein